MKVQYRIGGMACGFCVATIGKAIGRLPDRGPFRFQTDALAHAPGASGTAWADKTFVCRGFAAGIASHRRRH